MELGDVFPDRPMQSGRLFVPRDIQLDGEFLSWLWVPPWASSDDKKVKRRVAYREAKPGMLAGFLRLHSATDIAILGYARRWGVLGLCEHWLPCSHNQYPYGAHDGVRSCLPMLTSPPEGSSFRLREPLAAWRVWSQKAQALINIGARLNQGKIAGVEDWQALKELPSSPFGTEPFMESVAMARDQLAFELDGWISIGQVRPRISWRKDQARFSLDAVSSGPNLFGLLALNIAVAIAAGHGEQGLAVCSACGLSYIPDRRPNPDRRNYCEKCRLKAARREASRQYRQRERMKRVS
jgi:hypothetical protein